MGFADPLDPSLEGQTPHDQLCPEGWLCLCKPIRAARADERERIAVAITHQGDLRMDGAYYHAAAIARAENR